MSTFFAVVIPPNQDCMQPISRGLQFLIPLVGTRQKTHPTMVRVLFSHVNCHAPMMT